MAACGARSPSPDLSDLVIAKLTEKQAERTVRFASHGFDRDADRAIERLGADRVLAALDLPNGAPKSGFLGPDGRNEI